MRKTLMRALRESGKILMQHFGKIKSVDLKHNQSNIVTVADIASEKCILAIINGAFPTHNTVAEETGCVLRNSEYTWIIDPLDGTSNFAAGIPWFGILIAVTKKNKPVLAGMYLPYDDLLYIAEKGKGATCNNKRISVTNETDLKKVLLCYGIDFSEDSKKIERETKLIKLLVQNIRNLRATNSTIDNCYTADGRIGAGMNQTEKIWDIAAPYLVIREAGGIVTDIHGKDIDFSVTNKNYLRNFTHIAANKTLHRQLIKLTTS